MRVAETRFIRSAARPADFPADGCPEIALAGRSNVGKSSLINALVRRDVARTSAAPGKTRLVNLYRVEPGGRAAAAFYLADLPGYGHAGGGEESAREFDRLTDEYFRLEVTGYRLQGTGYRLQGGVGDQRSGARRLPPAGSGSQGDRGRRRWIAGVVLAIDARHPGLARDVAAYRWFGAQEAPVALVATKSDKLSQADRARLGRDTATSFGVAALAVSAVTGEGLEQLWTHLLKWIRRK